MVCVFLIHIEIQMDWGFCLDIESPEVDTSCAAMTCAAAVEVREGTRDKHML